MLIVILSLLTGIVYPAVVTVIAQVFFNNRANGSLILRENEIVGSKLIGQQFTSTKYFWGRPSATTPMPYNAASSNASNLGTSNPALITAINQRITALTQANPAAKNSIPIELVTTSASGLDPDLSVVGAYYQAQRIATERKMALNDVLKIIDTNTFGLGWGIFGIPRVNVLQLNLALDALEGAQHHGQ